MSACQSHVALFIAACEIADSIMPDTRRDELLADVFGEHAMPAGEAPTPATPTALQPHRRVRSYRIQRDPRFARAVLAAYGHQCAVCRAAPRLGADRFGLEAAHIRWVQYDGPNHLANGLCLWRMHHVALDRGAFTIGDGYRVQVSPLLDRSEASARLFWSFDGQAISRPVHHADRPHDDHCRWHREEVFLAPD
jgi:predicted restriction endonuclease